jgi:cell division protein FtsQ
MRQAGGRGAAAPGLARDPAPSRLAYRLERLWLRPLVRRAVRIGLPLLAGAGAALWWASEPARVAAVTDAARDLRRAVEERPEFMVRLMAIDGASPELARAVRQMVPVDLPVSSFDLDLAAMRAQIETIDAVAAAHLRIRPGGTLEVAITEREPALIWRRADGLMLVDATGHPIAAAERRADWPELPLIAGEGANAAAEEALALVAAAAPLSDRLRGLLRRGERRWDVVLTRDQRILLPASEPVPALDYLLALDEANDLLARDVTHVDLRLPDRPTLRLSEAAVAELARIRDPEASGEREQ